MRLRGLSKLPDGRAWLWGNQGLALMGKAMLSKSLIQFSVDGQGWHFNWTQVSFSLTSFFFWSFSFTHFRKLLECVICSVHTLILLARILPLTCLCYNDASSMLGNTVDAPSFAMVTFVGVSLPRGMWYDQGLNPCFLHWQADSYLLCQQGSPHLVLICISLMTLFMCLLAICTFSFQDVCSSLLPIF